MFLDQVYHFLNTGRYMPTPDLPTIPHPVVPLIGNLFYCLSTSAAADGTRAEDFYLVNCQGVRPVCSCPGFAHRRECAHIGIVEAEMPALIAEVDALLAADRAARKAARMARQEGRAA